MATIVTPRRRAAQFRPPRWPYVIERGHPQLRRCKFMWDFFGGRAQSLRAGFGGSRFNLTNTGSSIGHKQGAGKGRDFDGALSRVVSTSAAWHTELELDLSGFNEATITALVTPTATGVLQYVTADWNSEGMGLTTYLRANATNDWTAYSGGFGTMTGGTVTQGQPTWLVFTIPAYLETARLYVNAVEVATVTVTAAKTAGTESIGLGNQGDYAIGNGWTGLIHEVRAYTRELSPPDVAMLYDPATRWDIYDEYGQKSYFLTGVAPTPSNPSKVGSQDVVKKYIGGTEVIAEYVGAAKIWPIP